MLLSLKCGWMKYWPKLTGLEEAEQAAHGGASVASDCRLYGYCGWDEPLARQTCSGDGRLGIC